ncbi:MAG: helix-turn-helix domain-containing protein [Actinomycetota bacterium]|nr:helix-turn-helix domain-containing protein [Actinomycetota bacterium]
MHLTKKQCSKKGIWMRVKDAGALRRKRERAGLTQRDLAFLCRCSQNTIHLLETGGMATLSEGRALIIAKRLGADWEDLFEPRSLAMPDVATVQSNARRQRAS